MSKAKKDGFFGQGSIREARAFAIVCTLWLWWSGREEVTDWRGLLVAIICCAFVFTFALLAYGLAYTILTKVWHVAYRPLLVKLGMLKPMAADHVLAARKAERAGRFADALTAYDEAIRLDLACEEAHFRRDDLLVRYPDLPNHVKADFMPRHMTEAAFELLSLRTASRLFDLAESSYRADPTQRHVRHENIPNASGKGIEVFIAISALDRIFLTVGG